MRIERGAFEGLCMYTMRCIRRLISFKDRELSWRKDMMRVRVSKLEVGDEILHFRSTSLENTRSK
jgi:hypothetical protein